MFGNVQTGTVEGTGSAINIQLGWIPDYVKVYNYDDAGSLAPTIEWWRGMTDGHGLKSLSVVDNATTGNASQAKVTSNGISAYGGTEAGNREGFTIGADSDINASGETLFWVAYRNGDRDYDDI